MNPKIVKIAAIVPVIFLAVFAVIFFSNQGGGNNNAPAGVAQVFPAGADKQASPQEMIDPDKRAFVEDSARWNFSMAGIPEHIASSAFASLLESPAFYMELLAVLQQDPYTFLLVDKQNPLPLDYEPDDLLPLAGGSYRIARNDLTLRKMAVDALEEMAAAAAADGVVLTAGSAYRSGPRQAVIYNSQVSTYGQEAADRQSARPGHSQHQLGLAVDFSPIDDSFAETPASRWLLRNAGRFGFSLSFPDGYEAVTGYRYEPWHYRYVGRNLTAFIDAYFDGIQQYALQFIKVWQEEPQEY